MPELKHSFSEGDLVAGNYRVLSIAGSGGMGVVYRALDMRLERTVALKFLPPELNSSERDKERFLREARTASSLDHPNIGVIHGVEETADGLAFIVMAYYEGATLAERIRRGRLSAHEAIGIASQMARGLAEAHSHGIVHRDVKPSNVMLTTAGVAKIVDFGLARVVSEETTSNLGITGTVRYMSPEQVMGRPIDQRCDLWALGVVFAEMVTGDTPFHGETVPATLYAIVNEPPRSIGLAHPALQPVLYRALTKDTARRYGSCAEFLRDLEGAAGQIPITAQQAADGEDTLPPDPSRGSKPSGQVRRARADAARSAWMPAGRQRAPLRKWLAFAFPLLGLALVVLLVPPLRRQAMLLIAGTPAEKRAAVLSSGNIGSNPAGTAAVHNGGGAENPAAYEDYLTALGYIQRFDKPGNLELAIASLQRSVKTDPGFALGYAELGEAYRLKYQADQNPRWLDEAQANCKKAAELDNRVPSVFATLGQIHDVLGKHDLALQEFHQALDLDPKNAAALGGLARSYERSGRIADAEKAFEDAAAMSPEDWNGYNRLGAFYDRQARYPQAFAAYRHALEITPDNAELYSNLGSAYLDAGGRQYLAEAEKDLKRSIALNPSYTAYANLGNLYFQEKRYAEAATATEDALGTYGNDYRVWSNLEVDYEALKQTGKAETARRKAEQLAEQAVELKPRDEMAQSSLAIFYAYDKLNEKALARVRTSLALAPDDPNVLSNVGEAYELMGDREQALKYIEKAMRKGYALDDIANDPSLQALIADPRFKPPGK